MAEEQEPTVETFRPTSGRVTGVAGLATAAVVLGAGVIQGFPMWVMGAVGAFAVLVWAAVVRPGVSMTRDALVLRNMFDTTRVPLGGIEEVHARQMLVVRAADGRRHVSPAIGRSVRQMVRRPSPLEPQVDTTDLAALARESYAEYVAERIRLAAHDHRRRLGISTWSPEQVELAGRWTKERALLELGALLLCGLLFLLGVLIGS